MKDDFKVLIICLVAFFCFILGLIFSLTFAHNSCLERVKDKPALEMYLICR